MKNHLGGRLLAAALCILLAGCGAKEPKNDLPDPQTPSGTVQTLEPPVSAVQDEEPVLPEGPASAGVESNPTADPSPSEPVSMPKSPDPAVQDIEGEEPVLPEESGTAGAVEADYVGTWRDSPRGTSGGRCMMTIACTSGVYAIDIYWGSSAAVLNHWQFTGTYDEAKGAIAYTGAQYTETTLEDGTVERIVESEDAAGWIAPGAEGTLLWEDASEHRGDGMQFEREA